jgi:hypothetical protein
MKKLVLASLLAVSLSALAHESASANGCLNFGFGANFSLWANCDPSCASGCCCPCFPCIDPALLGVPYGGYPGLPYAYPPGGYGHAFAGYAFAPTMLPTPTQPMAPTHSQATRPIQPAVYSPASYHPGVYNYPSYPGSHYPYGFHPSSGGFGN